MTDGIRGMPVESAAVDSGQSGPEGSSSGAKTTNRRPPGYKARRAGRLGRELNFLAIDVAQQVVECVNKHSHGVEAVIWLAESPESAWYSCLERFWPGEVQAGIQAIRGTTPMGTVLDALGALAKPAARRLANGLGDTIGPAGQLLNEEDITTDFCFLIAKQLVVKYSHADGTEAAKTIRVVGLGPRLQPNPTSYILYSTARIQTLQWRRRWLPGHRWNDVVGSFLLVTGSGEVVGGDQIRRPES